ncbi:MAG: PH domain-containing protein [Candidatus Nezhaarchaeota archaeon]|nr:PH domain-containing protein [Candidatus Nezhaarchaeota archaeon]
MPELKVGEKFKPHPDLKKVYGIYLLLVAIPVSIGVALPIWAVYTFAPQVWRVAWPLTFIPLIVAAAAFIFVAYWIRKYYETIYFVLDKDEVVTEKGVWWRMRHVVPYSRVMSVDVIQGPISRRFGVGSVHVYTAGYTGPAGGTAGFGTRGAEAVIWGVKNFVEVRDAIINMVRARPLFAPPAVTADIGSEILEELRKIRRALEK